MLRLQPTGGGHAALTLPAGTVTFGRKVECTHSILHKKISGLHCVLEVSQDGDLSRVQEMDRSTNGTFIDDMKLESGVPTELPVDSVLSLAVQHYDEVPTYRLTRVVAAEGRSLQLLSRSEI